MFEMGRGKNREPRAQLRLLMPICVTGYQRQNVVENYKFRFFNIFKLVFLGYKLA